MEQVDFGYIGLLGSTIYRMCFQKYLNVREKLKVSKADWLKLMKKTEEIFFFLVNQGIRNGYHVGSILETPDSMGGTCFQIASICIPYATNIMFYILERDIKVNSIKTDMEVPAFTSSDLTIQMMKKGINPYVIDYNGNSNISKYSTHFESEEAKDLLSRFSRSVHFSIEDIKCQESCPADCSSKFERFYYKNGPLVEMTEKNQIGSGGFGSVFKQFFHGIRMAMKCTLLGDIKEPDNVKYAVNDLEENIAELRIQIATVGSGVIVPVAFIRQQNQEQDENGKWVTENYDIYIYPLYDCNLYELHENYYGQFTDEILRKVLCQCLTRKCSPRVHKVQ